jgi:peroxiredoxin
VARGRLVALIVFSITIPAVLLAFILRDDDGNTSSTGTTIVAPAPQRAKVGTPAPDFTLPDIDGNPVSLSQFRGRPVVLNFFASWCNPCEKEMPALEAIQQAEGERVAIVGVNYKDFEGDTRAFVRRLGVTFPTLVQHPNDNPVAGAYDVHAMPDTVFIDPDGIVRQRLYGPTTEADVREAVDRLINE